MIKKLDHLVITTEKPEECLLFYRALGFEVRDGGGRYELFAGDIKINVHLRGRELEPKAAHVTPGSADLCFEMDCPIEHCKKTLEEKGISIELGIVVRHGVRGEMKSLYLRDPDQNLVELSSYR